MRCLFLLFIFNYFSECSCYISNPCKWVHVCSFKKVSTLSISQCKWVNFCKAPQLIMTKSEKFRLHQMNSVNLEKQSFYGQTALFSTAADNNPTEFYQRIKRIFLLAISKLIKFFQGIKKRIFDTPIYKAISPFLGALVPLVKNASDDLSVHFSSRNNSVKSENTKKTAEYELEKARSYVKKRIQEV